jgi:transcriptional regulator with XRE-family HTH domain
MTSIVPQAVAATAAESEEGGTLGARIIEAREAMGLTTAQLARRLGVRTSTIAGWESNRTEPRSNRLQMLAGLLGVSPTWLLVGLGTPPRVFEENERLQAEIGAIRTDAARLLERLNALDARLGSVAG